MNRPPTRVVVVEDSPTQRAFLRQSLEAEGDIVVIGEAGTAASAVAAVVHGSPDIVTVDLDIPGGGQALIERIMRSTPRPILVLSGQVAGNKVPNATRALGAGAVAVMAKPMRWDAASQKELRRRVRTLRSVRIPQTVTHATDKPGDAVAAAMAASEAQSPARPQPPATVGRTGIKPRQILAIGASTGGPSAIAEVLKGLKGFDVPALVVQHIGPQSVEGMAEWLARASGWPVKVAHDGQAITTGEVLLSPHGRHLHLAENSRVALVEHPTTAHRPSADELFRSMAKVAGSTGIGILLTGMGSDGAEGLLAMRQAGALTVAQDEASSAVFGMPKAAIDLGAARHTLALSAIAPTVLRLTRGVW